MSIKLTLKQKIRLFIQTYTRMDRIKCLFGFHKYVPYSSGRDNNGVVCNICFKEIRNNKIK